MFSIITHTSIIDNSNIKAEIHKNIQVKAQNIENLLVYWLSELLYIYESEEMLFSDFNIMSINEKALKADISGEKIDFSRHHIEGEIKNVTFHEMYVRKESGRWIAQVIFDV